MCTEFHPVSPLHERTVVRLLQAVALLEHVEQVLVGDSGVGESPKGADLPEGHSIGPHVRQSCEFTIDDALNHHPFQWQTSLNFLDVDFLHFMGEKSVILPSPMRLLQLLYHFLFY